MVGRTATSGPFDGMRASGCTIPRTRVLTILTTIAERRDRLYNVSSSIFSTAIVADPDQSQVRKDDGDTGRARSRKEVHIGGASREGSSRHVP